MQIAYRMKCTLLFSQPISTLEIDGWVIDAIKAIGIDTAKAVLNAPREMLIEKTDLEEETVDEVLRILKQEFEEENE